MSSLFPGPGHPSTIAPADDCHSPGQQLLSDERFGDLGVLPGDIAGEWFATNPVTGPLVSLTATGVRKGQCCDVDSGSPPLLVSTQSATEVVFPWLASVRGVGGLIGPRQVHPGSAASLCPGHFGARLALIDQMPTDSAANRRG